MTSNVLNYSWVLPAVNLIYTTDKYKIYHTFSFTLHLTQLNAIIFLQYTTRFKARIREQCNIGTIRNFFAETRQFSEMIGGYSVLT